MDQRVKSGVVASLDLVVLAGARPDWPAVVRGCSAPHAWLADVGVDVAAGQLARTLLWLAACWIAVALLLSCAARLPGIAGCVAGRLAGLLLPRILARLLAGTVGLGLLATPAAAMAVPTVSTTAVSATAVSTPPTTPSPPAWPTAPTAPTPPPAPTAPAAPEAQPPAATAPQAAVVVAPGDCLWVIAQRRLGPGATAAQVAAQWPRWWSANRNVVGGDPSLIHPGQRLNPPAA